MKTYTFRITVLTIAALFCLGLSVSPVTAYDKAKCKKSVNKLYKLVKPYKDVKFKSLLVTISKLDDSPGGLKEEELKERIDVPFKNISWSKKFIKYLNKVEEHCQKGDDKKKK